VLQVSLALKVPWDHKVDKDLMVCLDLKEPLVQLE